MRKMTRLAIAALAAAGAAMFTGGGEARADATCTQQVTNIVNQLGPLGSYDFELTFHRTDVTLVEYSSGSLWRWTNTFWPITGTSNQLFSDRRAGNQPFNINASDSLTIWISTTGQLYIHYMPWNFNTSWDMGCTGGNTFTRIVPGFGVVTLTIRAFHPPIG